MINDFFQRRAAAATVAHCTLILFLQLFLQLFLAKVGAGGAV